MKITCYGDSNTYGWDPRFFSGNRYEHSWPDLVSENTGCELINRGEPGRVIPFRKEYLEFFRRDIETDHPDLLMIMLGTNDILNIWDDKVHVVAERMEMLADYASGIMPSEKILLLSCPKADIENGYYMSALQELSAVYRCIAEKKKTGFIDTFSWEIPMAYDGIHFSEEGHRIFAEKISSWLKKNYRTEG